MPEDELHALGSALLTFKIDNLPVETQSTTLSWYVNMEKKIGSGDWIGVSMITTAAMFAEHQTQANQYTYEILWIEDYAWTGTETISYRVNVVLEDLIGSSGGNSPYSNIAMIGLNGNGWALGGYHW